MSPRHRFFRIWLVVSALWLIVVGALTYRYFPDDLVGGAFRLELIGLREFPSPPAIWRVHRVDRDTAAKWDADGSMHRMTMPDRSVLYVEAENSQERREFFAREFWRLRFPRIVWAAGLALGSAILPILAVLVIGVVALRMRRGHHA